MENWDASVVDAGVMGTAGESSEEDRRTRRGSAKGVEGCATGVAASSMISRSSAGGTGGGRVTGLREAGRVVSSSAAGRMVSSCIGAAQAELPAIGIDGEFSSAAFPWKVDGLIAPSSIPSASFITSCFSTSSSLFSSANGVPFLDTGVMLLGNDVVLAPVPSLGTAGERLGVTLLPDTELTGVKLRLGGGGGAPRPGGEKNRSSSILEVPGVAGESESLRPVLIPFPNELGELSGGDFAANG